MKEVWIPSSLKKDLSHACREGDNVGKGVKVRWGESCEECGATNPPVNEQGKWGRAELVTDERAAELLEKFPGLVVLWEDHLNGVGIPDFLRTESPPASSSPAKAKRRGR